eukprot:921389_1
MQYTQKELDAMEFTPPPPSAIGAKWIPIHYPYSIEEYDFPSDCALCILKIETLAKEEGVTLHEYEFEEWLKLKITHRTYLNQQFMDCVFEFFFPTYGTYGGCFVDPKIFINETCPETATQLFDQIQKEANEYTATQEANEYNIQPNVAGNLWEIQSYLAKPSSHTEVQEKKKKK